MCSDMFNRALWKRQKRESQNFEQFTSIDTDGIKAQILTTDNKESKPLETLCI